MGSVCRPPVCWASHLDVSRSTAQLAYEQLLSEGYIEAIPCKGYFVCQMEALYRLDTAPVKPERIVEPEPNTYRYDFTPNGIDLKHFPFAAWRKLNREVLQQDESDLFLLGEASGGMGAQRGDQFLPSSGPWSACAAGAGDRGSWK